MFLYPQRSRAEINSDTIYQQRLFGCIYSGVEQFRHCANQKSYLQRGGGHLWLHSGSGGHLGHNIPTGYKSSSLYRGGNRLTAQRQRGLVLKEYA